MSGASTAGAPRPARRATSLDVPHQGSGVRLARHTLAHQMDAAGIAQDARDDAILVISELLSNAVQHAAPLSSGQITVRWSVRADVLLVEIIDGGASTRPQARVAALNSLGGRGLEIVRMVSRQWGVTEADDSVTVWAEVPTQP